MNLKILILLSVTISIASAGVTCDVSQAPASWATISAKYPDFSAWQPANYMKIQGFCVLNDYFSYSLNYWSHVKLAGNATVQQDYVDREDVDSSKVNCGFDSDKVIWCQSHCQNKTWESAIIKNAVDYGFSPLTVTQHIYSQFNSPMDMTVAAINIDQNDTSVNPSITYDYYDDVNFCSVCLKIKRSDQLPYVMLLTVQKIISLLQ